MSAFANCGRAVAHVRGSYVPLATDAPQTKTYSITSSARAIKVGWIVTPNAFAVLRFIRNSNFVGCSTGRSPGFVPLRMAANRPVRVKRNFRVIEGGRP